MKHILKTLDENIKQSGDLEQLNEGCKYYKRMLNYMENLLYEKEKNPEVYDLMVKLCYETVNDESIEDDLTPERIEIDTEIVRGHLNDYYRIMLPIVENNMARRQ